MGRGRTIAVGVVAVIVVVAGAVWFVVGRGDDSDPERAGMSEDDPASQVADEYALAFSTGTLGEVAYTPESGDVPGRVEVITAGLGLGDARPTVTVTSLERAEGDDGRATASLEVTWPLDGDRTWTNDAAVDVVEGPAGEWLVDWTPSAVHPRLGAGDRFEVVRMAARRGEVLGLDGNPIVGDRPVVVVGFRPGDASDLAGSARQLASAVGVDAESLVSRAQGANPGTVLSVITLRAEAFEEVRSWVSSIPGVVLTETELPLAPTRDFARAVLGTVGPATAEIAAASGGRVAEGETVGVSGLQAAQDEVLGGLPGLSVRVVPDDPNAEPFTVEDVPAVPGRPVTVTLDPAVQAAADEVMAAAPSPAALVAVRVSTGDVLAVANGPAGADGYNRAFVGRYPPGSVFKVASGLAILGSGVTADTVVPCPATYVAGKEFSNAGGFVLGDVPFRTDFARSCNTAFVSLADDVDDDALAAAAATLGYGRDLDVGVPAFGSSVPLTDSAAEHASNMIGQGKVEVSPLAVASASASIAAGRTVTPRLVVDPDAPAPEPGAPIEGAATIAELMRAVVLEGSGTAVADVPGDPVHGKTGTAEYGTEDPPKTHVWFTGFQGDIAFAVLVEDGSSGGAVAAPIAASFLTALAQP